MKALGLIVLVALSGCSLVVDDPGPDGEHVLDPSQLSDTDVETDSGHVTVKLFVDVGGTVMVWTQEGQSAECEGGTDCEFHFPVGSQVDLQAVPTDGIEFVAWKYDACVSAAMNPCELRLDSVTPNGEPLMTQPEFALRNR